MNNTNENNNMSGQTNPQTTPTDIFGTKVELTGGQANQVKKDNPIPPAPQKTYTGLYHPELANKQPTSEPKLYNPVPNTVNNQDNTSTNNQNMPESNAANSIDNNPLLKPMEPVPNNVNNQANVSNNNQNMASNTSNADEALLRAFIGPNYDKLISKKFNFAAAFFGYLYMFYRQMVLYGLLSIFIFSAPFTVILNLTNTTMSNHNTTLVVVVVYIVWCIISFLAYGFLTNKVYIHYVKKRIAKIKLKNPNKNRYELEEICKRQGGTSIGKLIFGIFIPVIFIIIFLVLSLFVLGSMFGAFTTGVNNAKVINDPSTETSYKYDGEIEYDTTANLTDAFDFTEPDYGSGITMNRLNLQYHYEVEVYHKGWDYGVCDIHFYKAKDYNSANNLLTDIQKYHNTTVKNYSALNGINWLYTSASVNECDNVQGPATREFYIADKNNGTYVVNACMDEKGKQNCLEYKDKILAAIKSK